MLLNNDFEDGLANWDAFGAVFVESDPSTLVKDSLALKMFGNFDPNRPFSVVSQYIAVDGSHFGVGDVISLSGLMGHLSVDALQGINKAYLEIAFAYNDVIVEAIDFDNATRSMSIDSSFATDTFFDIKTPAITIPELVFGQSTQFIRVAVAFFQENPSDLGAIWADNLQLNLVSAPSAVALFLLTFMDMLFVRRK